MIVNAPQPFVFEEPVDWDAPLAQLVGPVRTPPIRVVPGPKTPPPVPRQSCATHLLKGYVAVLFFAALARVAGHYR